MYSFSSRVRFSEVDHTKKITLPGIINYFQDCSTFHSDSLGLGIDYYRKHKRAWVLMAWQIVTTRYPQMGEEITISTWATKFTGLYGYRNFTIKDIHGITAAYANSVWAYMDIEKGRPVKPDAREIETYGCEPELLMEFAPRKIVCPDLTPAGEPFTVRSYQIDTNEHVNNGQYVQMALEALGQDIEVNQVRAEYKKSAVYQDSIIPRMAREKDRTVVALCDVEGQHYAVIELKEKTV